MKGSYASRSKEDIGVEVEVVRDRKWIEWRVVAEQVKM